MNHDDHTDCHYCHGHGRRRIQRLMLARHKNEIVTSVEWPRPEEQSRGLTIHQPAVLCLPMLVLFPSLESVHGRGWCPSGVTLWGRGDSTAPSNGVTGQGGARRRPEKDIIIIILTPNKIRLDSTCPCSSGKLRKAGVSETCPVH